jgi:hypothetical protein
VATANVADIIVIVINRIIIATPRVMTSMQL